MMLTFNDFQYANLQRCKLWHPGWPNDGWNLADWSNAMCGEAGETANIVKKIRRLETTDTRHPHIIAINRQSLMYELADEIADTLSYLDLLASKAEINVEHALIKKFNEVSDRKHFPIKL